MSRRAIGAWLHKIDNHIWVDRRSRHISIRAFMKAVILFRLALGIVLLAFVPGCEQMETARQTASRAVYAVMPRPSGYWNGDDVSGSPKIVVHLSEQKAYFYKGKHLVGESTVSTANADSAHPSGTTASFRKIEIMSRANSAITSMTRVTS